MIVVSMRMTIIAVTLATLFSSGFRACAADASDEMLIRKLLTEQSAAWNRGDGAAWARDFTDDADFVNIRGDVIRGCGEISQKISGALSTVFKGSILTVDIRRFVLLTPDAALIDANFDLTGFGTLAPGITPTNDDVLKTRMKYIALKRDGQWRFVSAQNTAIVRQERAE